MPVFRRSKYWLTCLSGFSEIWYALLVLRWESLFPNLRPWEILSFPIIQLFVLSSDLMFSKLPQYISLVLCGYLKSGRVIFNYSCQSLYKTVILMRMVTILLYKFTHLFIKNHLGTRCWTRKIQKWKNFFWLECFWYCSFYCPMLTQVSIFLWHIFIKACIF